MGEGGGDFLPLLFYIVLFCFVFHRYSWAGPLSEEGKKRGKVCWD